LHGAFAIGVVLKDDMIDFIAARKGKATGCGCGYCRELRGSDQLASFACDDTILFLEEGDVVD